jgi:hypothetical protein
MAAPWHVPVRGEALELAAQQSGAGWKALPWLAPPDARPTTVSLAMTRREAGVSLSIVQRSSQWLLRPAGKRATNAGILAQPTAGGGADACPRQSAGRAVPLVASQPDARANRPAQRGSSASAWRRCHEGTVSPPVILPRRVGRGWDCTQRSRGASCSWARLPRRDGHGWNVTPPTCQRSRSRGRWLARRVEAAPIVTAALSSADSLVASGWRACCLVAFPLAAEPTTTSVTRPTAALAGTGSSTDHMGREPHDHFLIRRAVGRLWTDHQHGAESVCPLVSRSRGRWPRRAAACSSETAPTAWYGRVGFAAASLLALRPDSDEPNATAGQNATALGGGKAGQWR